MSDTAKRDAVLEEFAHDAGVHRVWGVAGMADEIMRLRAENDRLQKEFDIVRSMLEQQIPLLNRWQDENTRLRAAIERVRAACENELRWIDAQPVLRALEETP